MFGLVIWCIGWELGQLLVCEFYVDCDYDCSGFIVFIWWVVVFDLQQVVDKVLCVCCEGKVCIVEGEDFDIVFDLVCIYSDIFGVLELVVSICVCLEGVGICIKVLC